ncbi:MAG: FAD-linked oxidase C-terminal domain-containing protein, partial [Chloroflexota bacterium]
SDGEDAAANVSVLMAVIGATADNVTVMAAPPSWKRGVDIWGVAPETLDVMESLKEQFDPRRVLNPGRFAGSI